MLQNQYDALVLLCYNIGVGNFKSSSVLTIVNGGSSQEYGSDIKAVWLAWIYSQGIENDSLKNRRNYELNVYNQGVYKKW
ncbi:hypothetical protein VSP9026_00139 [Vibrio spartinae]|uniref:Lysozyme n=1 Tax=Vibrio spartinae TaxID=1918945 RepID=A0A1N6LZH2_9VIBR|nr:hypothetical protein VSP9026_00139 [Vibrio spartinae]